MSDIERLRIRLAESLKQTALKEPRIEVFKGTFHEVFVRILSPSFEKLDEAERQEIVWSQIFSDLDPDDRELITFIYTQSPSEYGEVFGEKRLAEFGAESPR